MGILHKSNMIKSYHIARMLSVFSLFLFVLLSLTTLIPIYNTVDKAEAAVGTSTESKITFTSTRSTASVSLNVSDSDGTFATSANNEKAAFTIATNNYTGYTLTLKSSSNTTTLSNANGTINTLLSSTTYSTFSADTSEGKALNNRWGYIPNYYNATGASPVENTTNYYPAPTTQNIATLRTTSSANSANGEDNPDNYTIGLGLRADFTNPTGTYTNDALILEFVANPVAYSITYADNTNDSSVSGIPAVQSGSTTGTEASSTEAESITLSNATPTRTRYTFSGWCLGTVSNSGTTCEGTTYAKSASFGIDKTNSNNVTLYAVWTADTYTITLTNTNATTNGSTSATATYDSSTLSSITNPSRAYSFSGFTKTNSAYNATVSDTTTKTYTYTFDGWYTAESGGYKVINADGTLVSSAPNGTATLTNGSSKWISTSGTTLYAHWTAGTNQTLPTITQTDSTNGNGNCYWSSSASSTGAQTYASGATISSPTAGAILFGVCKFPVKITFAGTGISSVAVKSGSTSGTTVGTVVSSGGSVSNLTYGTTYYLVPTYTNNYELDNWKKTSAKGTLAGTSTQNTTSTTANPSLTIGTTSTTGAVGITITGKASCTVGANLTGTMQSFSPSSSYCNGSYGTLTDARDSKTYTVRKLPDGKWWMTSNLDLAGGTTISCTTSDCENYTIPTDQGWQTGGKLPASSTSGFDNDNYAYVYNSGSTTCGSDSPCYSYYSWDAATLGSGRSISTNNVNAPYSICPKGWKLPTTYSSSGTVAETRDFRALMIALGGSNSVSNYTSSTSPTGANMYSRLTTYGFVLAGYYASGSYYNGSGITASGNYWSATSDSMSTYTNARYLDIKTTSVSSAKTTYRKFGFSVRCVFGG